MINFLEIYDLDKFLKFKIANSAMKYTKAELDTVASTIKRYEIIYLFGLKNSFFWGAHVSIQNLHPNL